MKRLVQSITICVAVVLINISFGQSITPDMQKFLNYAVQKNGDSKGLSSEDTAKALNMTFVDRKSRRGRVTYESASQLLEPIDTPVFQMSFQSNVMSSLTLNFTEPVEIFLAAAKRLKGYEERRRRVQINGNYIYFFEGVDIHSSTVARKFWIRVYDCSSDPKEKCVRTAELIYAARNTIL